MLHERMADSTQEQQSPEPPTRVAKKSVLTRREFLAKASKLGVAIVGTAILGSLGTAEAEAPGVEQKPASTPIPAAELDLPTRKVHSEKLGFSIGYLTAREKEDGVFGGDRVMVSVDKFNAEHGDTTWFTDLPLNARSPDADGKVPKIAILNSFVGERSGWIYLVYSNSAADGYKDTRSGVGFIRDPGQFELIRTDGNHMEVVGEISPAQHTQPTPYPGESLQEQYNNEDHLGTTGVADQISKLIAPFEGNK